MLRQIAVMRRIGRSRDADRSRHKAMRLVGSVIAYDGKDDLAGLQVPQPFLRRNQFASRWKDRIDAHQVEIRDLRGPKRQLERTQFFAMHAEALGEKDAVRNRPHLSDTPRCHSLDSLQLRKTKIWRRPNDLRSGVPISQSRSRDGSGLQRSNRIKMKCR